MGCWSVGGWFSGGFLIHTLEKVKNDRVLKWINSSLLVIQYDALQCDGPHTHTHAHTRTHIHTHTHTHIHTRTQAQELTRLSDTRVRD